VISRKEAKIRGLTQYFTGKPCKNGHVDKRSTVNGFCRSCQQDSVKRNLAGKKARAARHYQNHADKYRKYSKEYRVKNPDKVKEYNRKYYKEHLAYFNEHSSRRYITKMNRIPKWADLDKIKAIYEECERITKETGILYHVDHYYPLQGETVCGLHVAENLQIITAKENLAKNNKHPDEFYE
jgi:hypothetical protein